MLITIKYVDNTWWVNDRHVNIFYISTTYLFIEYLLTLNSSQGIIDGSKLNTFSKLLYILQRLYTCSSNPFNITDSLVSECDKSKEFHKIKDNYLI